MKRFKNILYLLDQRTIGEGSSGDRVASLARINEARVTPLIVHESGLLENISSKLSKRFDEAQHIMREQRQQAFNLFLQQRYWQDIAIGQEYLEFDNFIPVIQKVIKDGHDLVIKEESLESGVDQLAMRLVRKCPCPVWVMKSGAKTFNHVLAAVDISADHPESQSLNKKIVELAHSLAQREHGKAHYLHAWRLEYEEMLQSPRMKVSALEIQEMKDELRNERRQQLTQFLERNAIGYDQKQVYLIEGESSEVIRRVIAEQHVDVVVMGSVARTGIPGLLIGNKAEKLLSTINCTVLTVKPDGFVSPVTID